MDDPKKPNLTPDGAREQRRDTDETDRSTVGEVQDPELPGDKDTDRGYANTDEAAPDADGLVRRKDDESPLV